MDVTIPAMTYVLNQADPAHLYQHLLECSPDFVPPLAGRVDLTDYSKKLFDRATRFEAWSRSDLIGLVAAYFDPSAKSKSVFVSSVSVAPAFRSRGIAARLMVRCHEHAARQNFHKINLETATDNRLAIAFYRKLGYVRQSSSEDVIKMELQLKSHT